MLKLAIVITCAHACPWPGVGVSRITVNRSAAGLVLYCLSDHRETVRSKLNREDCAEIGIIRQSDIHILYNV